MESVRDKGARCQVRFCYIYHNKLMRRVVKSQSFCLVNLEIKHCSPSSSAVLSTLNSDKSITLVALILKFICAHIGYLDKMFNIVNIRNKVLLRLYSNKNKSSCYLLLKRIFHKNVIDTHILQYIINKQNEYLPQGLIF